MAVIKAVHSKAKLSVAVNYITKQEKTQTCLVSGIHCDPMTAVTEMETTKQLWHKTNGRQYGHYIQSFAPDETLTPELAHDIARQWAEHQFPAYECLIATHIDRNHIHSHVIVNSVSYETGRKHHTSAYWLQQAKEYSDSLCREQGLSICVKGKTFDGQERTDATAWSKDKYQLMEKAASGEAHSFLLDIAVAVCLVLKSALNREDFVQGLLDYGISTAWTDKRKYITFTDLEGNKVRNKKLTETFHFDFSKESLEHEFTKRCREASERQPTAPLATAGNVAGRVQRLDVGGHSGVTPPAETASRPDERASDQRQSLASRLERARKSVAEQNQRQSEQSFSFDELLAEGIRESERQNQQQQRRKDHRRELER